MKKIEHDEGAPLTEYQKMEVLNVFEGFWKETMKPDIAKMMEENNEKQASSNVHVNRIRWQLIPIRIKQREYYLAPAMGITAFFLVIFKIISELWIH